jgi:hypothetical protein
LTSINRFLALFAQQIVLEIELRLWVRVLERLALQSTASIRKLP